ncbi:hypothetical protein SCHPADRAFT_435501 [Schizopora paradoxa]|uniref:Uncharacterized protein n=1 Tax=Schizopora paradoxa TaxID=27342 RepID=A0A0H2RJU0_9AGAM|nr:hypothetical protein SCHPADRAFT_435501 [Schizopora paradoxa]
MGKGDEGFGANSILSTRKKEKMDQIKYKEERKETKSNVDSARKMSKSEVKSGTMERKKSELLCVDVRTRTLRSRIAQAGSRRDGRERGALVVCRLREPGSSIGAECEESEGYEGLRTKKCRRIVKIN